MSRYLEAKVWQSALDSTLKPLAACLADIANDDGTRIFPSVAYMAWLVGKDVRSIQRNLKELRDTGILTAVRNVRGGRNRATEYRFNEDKLPTREPWDFQQKGDKTSHDEKGDTPDPERVTKDPERVTKKTETVTPTPPDPLDPNTDPKTDPKTTESGKKASKGTRRDTDGTRIPEPFLLTAEMRKWAADPENAPDVNLRTATAEFVDYWRGVPGRRGKKLDWEATWRNRMRELQRKIPRRNGPPPKATASVDAARQVAEEFRQGDE